MSIHRKSLWLMACGFGCALAAGWAVVGYAQSGPQTRPAAPVTQPGNNDDKTIQVEKGTAIGFGRGVGAATQPGDAGQGGGVATFPHDGADQVGPHGPVFDAGGNALTITFVCDASGSMMEKIEELKRQLNKTIDALHPFQKFNVIFMQNQDCASFNKDLRLATPDNKEAAEDFVANVSTNGSTDPIPALRLAFKQQPQLIYLLTDGDFPNNEEVHDEIHKLDPDHKIKINTISFTDSADRDVDFKKLLKQIAEESSGTFKDVDEEKLSDH